MAIKKRITGALLSLAMLAPAFPVTVPVTAQAADEIPAEYVEAAQSWFSSQLNPQAKSIYDLLVTKFESGDMDDGVKDIDLNEAEEVDSDDVQAYLNGNRTLYNDFTAAKDAFDVEHPEAWYIDCDYLSFRAAKDADGIPHAYVGIGRADSYLVQGMSAEDVDVEDKVKKVNDKVKEIADAAEKVTLPNDQDVTIKDKIEKAHDLITQSISYRFEDEIEYDKNWETQEYLTEYHDVEEAKHYIRTPFALISHAGVCESYSRTFQMVMKEMGVPCVILHGVQTAGTPENHMWTAVQLPKPTTDNGAALTAADDPANDPNYAWYVCDLTWDDPVKYSMKWYRENEEKLGYSPEYIKTGNDGGENNTYLLVGNEIVGGSWELSPYFSTKDMAFTYPEIAPASYASNLLVDNPNGLSVKYAETGQMDDVKASVWEIRYKGMSLLQAHDAGYYFLCRMYSKHADGSVSQFDDWYYPEHMLYSLGDDPNNLTPHGSVHFHDTTAWAEAEDTKKYPEGQGALVMTFGQAEYIEFAITTKAPPEWKTAMDLYNLGGYYSGDGSDIIAETGMLYNKMGTYEAPPAVMRQTPSQTGVVYTSAGQVHHGVVEFNDRLYDPDAADEDSDHEYDETSNYAEAKTQALQLVPSYSNQMSQNPTYSNFKVTYACGETEDLELDYDSGAKTDGQGQMNNGENTPVYKFKNLKHHMNHTTDWNGWTNCRCGVVKIEYDMVTSTMWFDDNKEYMFNLKGLIGRQSDKLPSGWAWGFVTPSCALCYRSQGIDWNLWGQPRLMDGVEDIDMEKMRLKGVDGEEESLKDLTDKMGGSRNFKDGRMALVVEDMSQSASQGELNDELDNKTDVNTEDVLSRLVYDINFARLCCKTIVNPGQSIRLQVGFPYGFDASSIDEGIKFSAYHFTRCSAEGEANPQDVYGDASKTCPNKNKPGHKWGDDVLSVEPISVEVTPYGLVLIVDRFSPFEIIAVDENSPTGIALTEAELAESKKTLIVQREGDGTITKSDGAKATGAAGMVDISEGGSETFTITPEDGYQVSSVNLFGEELIGNEDKMTVNTDGEATVTVTADDTFNDNNPMLLVTFEAESVNEQNDSLGVTAELPKVCTHTNTVLVDADGNDVASTAAKVDATCAADGIIYGRKCTECGQIVTAAQIIPAKGHDMSSEVAPGTDATCDTDGVTPKVKCTVCGLESGGNVIPAKNHAYGEYTTVEGSATCQGTTVSATCAYCGNVATKKVPEGAVAHNFTDYKDNNDATCTQDGTETAKCEWCEETNTRTVAGSSTGHTVGPDGKCTKCDYYVCANGHAHKETLAGKDATCTKSGLTEGEKCADCGTITKAQDIIPAKGHTWGSEDANHNATCTVCGQKKTGDHIPVINPGKPATCTEDGLTDGTKCQNCGDIIKEQERIPALGHEWDTENPTWTWNTTDTVSATVTFKCKRCDVTHVVNVSPENIKEEVVTPATCKDKGKSKFTASVNIDNPADGLTGALKYSGTDDGGELETPTVPHKFGEYEVVTQASCTSNEIKRATCEYGCGETNEIETPDTKKPHEFGTAPEVTKEATCTEPGVNTYRCTNGCSIVKTELIPARGHSFDAAAEICAHCGQKENSKTEFTVSTVEELRAALNEPDLDRGDTIILTGGYYDLNEVTDDEKIENGVMHITQGITLISSETGKASDIALTALPPVMINGSISVETTDVTIQGLMFDEPAEINGEKVCIRNVDDGACYNLTIRDCSYYVENTEAERTAFAVIEGAQGVTMEDNAVKAADIVILPGNGVAMSGGVKINGNDFDNVKLRMSAQAVAADDKININDNIWGGNPVPERIFGADGVANAGYFALDTYTDENGKKFGTEVFTRITFTPNAGEHKVGMYIYGYNKAADGSGDTTRAAFANLMSAKVKVSIDGGLKITGFAVEPTLGKWAYSEENGAYTICEETYNPNDADSTGVAAYDCTAAGVRLGEFTIEGNGVGVIEAETMKDNVHFRGTDGSIVKSTSDGGSLQVAFADVMRKLVFNMEFNNNIKGGNSADYNDFTVTVQGDGYESTAKVGSGTQSGVMFDDWYYNGTKSTFDFENLPAPGKYTVTVTGAGYKKFTKEIDVTADKTDDIVMTVWTDVKGDAQTVVTGEPDSEKVNVTFLAGDVVEDYTVNANDLKALVSYFGKRGITLTDKKYIRYDLNRDGVVDSQDAAMVLLSQGN